MSTTPRIQPLWGVKQLSTFQTRVAGPAHAFPKRRVAPWAGRCNAFALAVIGTVVAASGCDSGGSTLFAEQTDPYAPAELPEDRSELPPVAPNGYFVVKNTIYTEGGDPYIFRGVDRPSLEWDPNGQELSEADYRNMAGWNSNVVRIALNQGFWLETSFFHSVTYQATVDQNIEWAKAAGMDVILDLHWSDRNDPTQEPEQQRMADPRSIEFWTSVANKYKGDGRVIFELYNEPHDVTPEVWLNGGRTTSGPPDNEVYDVVGMQDLYDAVRDAGADNLVIVGGLDYAYNLAHVTNFRVEGYNIAYATHPYDFPNKQASTWPEAFGYLAATDPIIATEFGDFSCDGEYNRELIAYCEERRISWTAWAWFPGSCMFPGLIADWDGTPNVMGSVVKEALEAHNP